MADHNPPSTAAPTAAGGGPVAPTPGALATLRPLPLSAVTLDPDGHLGRWQHLTATRTLPHCIARLESEGALGNLRHAAGESDEPYRGMWFADSDVYKTLEAAAWRLGADPADPVADFVATTTQLLAAAQQDDGYLDSWFQTVHPDQRWTDLKWGHELYCAGHLIQAGVAAARCGVSPELTALSRRLADLLVAVFGESGREGVGGHPEVEMALAELFRLTGHRPYLDLATRMIELRGRGLVEAASQASGLGARFGPEYFQDHAPVREAATATGHAVRQLYLESGVVDVATETRDEALLAASERLWDDLFGTKTYLSGAHGSRHRDESIGDAFELPPDRAYAESCAAIASFMWNWRLLLATGRARYAEEMERVLYNGIAVSTAPDGTHFFYSNPLQLRAGHDGSDEDAPARRLDWYTCACCPPNLARLLAGLQGYLATTDASGAQLHLLTPARLRVAVPGGAAALTITTGYPWDGRVEVRVAATDSSEPWTLSVRVPAWCPEVRTAVDGQLVDGAEVRDGYLRLHRVWTPGASVTVELDLTARTLVAHPRIDAVRGCVALARGPLVYCLEQADLPADVALEDVRVDAATTPSAVAAPDLGDRAVALRVRGRVEPAAPRRPLYGSAGPGGGRTEPEPEPIELTAIPYYRWANRAPGPMRVWIPRTGS